MSKSKICTIFAWFSFAARVADGFKTIPTRVVPLTLPVDQGEEFEWTVDGVQHVFITFALIAKGWRMHTAMYVNVSKHYSKDVYTHYV